jgi:hypothetical protein
MRLTFARNALILPTMATLACVLFSGCGRTGIERASIYGNVTLDGQPVESGSVRLVCLEEKGGPSSGGDIVNGEYSIDEAKGPTLGRHRVEVYIPYNTGRKIPSPMGGPVAITEIDLNSPAPSNQNTAGMVDAWADKAPLKYNRESTLEINIESGSNQFDIPMASK